MCQSDSLEGSKKDALNDTNQFSEDLTSKMLPTQHVATINQHHIMESRLVEFQYQRHSLRISASNVAAIAGYHPYKNLPELFLQLVYQGTLGDLLLQRDSQLLGLTLVTPQEALNQLAKKAGVDKSLNEALKAVKKGEINTVEKAQTLKRTLTSDKVKKQLNQSEWEQFQEGIRSAVDTNYGIVHENAALDEYQKLCGWPVRERNVEIRSWAFARSEDVSDGRKAGHEKTAVPLREAESLVLSPLSIENEESERPSSNKKPKTVIDLTNDDNDDGENDNEKVNTEWIDSPSQSVVREQLIDETHTKSMKYSEALPYIQNTTNAAGRNETNNTCSKFVDVCVVTEKTQAKTTDATKNRVLPFFYILGSVDGIRDELAPSQANDAAVDFNDDDSWKMRSIIVECKHRMNRLHSPPLLYEQIQASVYCLMYGVTDADIVQVLRQDKKNSAAARRQGPDKSELSKQTKIEEFVNMDEVDIISTQNKIELEAFDNTDKPQILVSRVSLDDPTLQHRTNWTTIVLPRIRSFIDAVYLIRSSDDLRYRLLVSSTESELGSLAAWDLLHEQCPWLADCDTAFSRLKRDKV